MYSYIKKLIMSVLLLGFMFSGFSQLTPFTVSKINPGDSIVIYYDVLINTACGCTQISNQGTITGSNFTTISTNDPKTAAADDPTITVLNAWPLPVSLIDIKAVQKPAGIEVVWNVSYEANMWKYEVQRSTDGATFNTIGEVISLNKVIPYTYNFIDNLPATGVSFYRLKIIEFSPFIKYSPVVKIDLTNQQAELSVYPNPVVNDQMTVEFHNLAKGNYNVMLFNTAGDKVFEKDIYHPGGSQDINIKLDNRFPRGMYYLRIKGSNVQFSKMLVIQ